jgi:glycosyltransferase involved in cell wall biosynthesis
MRKKRILWVNEASWKNTGYSVYGREVLSRLCKVPEFEVAELACYATNEDAKKNPREWFVFPNNPGEQSEDYDTYINSPNLTFGEYTFNSVCLDFKPDIVMDIRDWWMFEYQQRCPFRDFFHWAIMPTVDAMPQNPQWINTFATADSVMTYSEFGRDTILNQCNKIKFVDIASPAASDDFFQVSCKATHKDEMGLDSDAFIIGTVMRNQRRKLYPDLFKCFKRLLEKTKHSNIFLHCHTYYPDIGWEIPHLLDMFELNNRVLFTYKCQHCNHVSVDFYRDSASYCNKCGNFSKSFVGIKNPIDEKELNKIYNLFDIYVQYANSEGFGMPQLEAASCGLPIVTVDYSAMQSVANNINAYAVSPIELSMECETGCYRAIPNNEELVLILEKMIQNRHTLTAKGSSIKEKSKQQYNWDKTAQIWIDHFRTVPIRDWSETWHSPPDIKTPTQTIPADMIDIVDQVNYLFTYVLHKPEWIGNYFWAKTIKDCTFGYRAKNAEEDYYFNESHKPNLHRYEPFDISKAGFDFTNFRNQWNQWEQIRAESINKSLATGGGE